MNFEFISSVRFWKLFIVAAAQFAAGQGWIPTDLAHAISLWLVGSIVIRTVDKVADK